VAHTTRPVRFRTRLGRLLTVTALTTGVALAAAPQAGADAARTGDAIHGMARPLVASADLAVDLRTLGSTLLPTIRYDVAITNNGPDPLVTATVTVPLDPRAHHILTSPCTFTSATDTVTCLFATVAAGATATVSFTAWFTLPTTVPATITATAARTASAPPDPNGSNDADTASCSWVVSVGWPAPTAYMRCPPQS